MSVSLARQCLGGVSILVSKATHYLLHTYVLIVTYPTACALPSDK